MAIIIAHIYLSLWVDMWKSKAAEVQHPKLNIHLHKARISPTVQVDMDEAKCIIPVM